MKKRKIMEKKFAGKIKVPKCVQRLSKAKLLEYIRDNSVIVADIIEPVLTDENVKRLCEDNWLQRQISKGVKKKANKITDMIKQKKHDKQEKNKEDKGVTMKIEIEIADVNIENMKQLVSAYTSETVVEVLSEAITETNIEKIMTDAWVQKKLIKILGGITCKKVKAIENGEEQIRKIKVRDVISIGKVNVIK